MSILDKSYLSFFFFFFFFFLTNMLKRFLCEIFSWDAEDLRVLFEIYQQSVILFFNNNNKNSKQSCISNPKGEDLKYFIEIP